MAVEALLSLVRTRIYYMTDMKPGLDERQERIMEEGIVGNPLWC